MSALFEAILSKDLEKVVEILGDESEDIDAIHAGMTPLMWATQLKSPEMSEALVGAGADADYATDDGETALHVESFEASNECVRALLRHGADVNAMTDLGKTPLMNAAQSGSAELVAALLAAGADVNAK